MVNCNPETVSTDPDTSDRLYFEPLTGEDVLEIVRREQEKGELLGVIVQLGGQTPLKLAAELQAAGVPILGTSPDSIDLAEDRERFAALVAASSASSSRPTASRAAATRRCGSPSGSAIRCCCGRPTCSAGAGMEVVDGPQQLDHYIATAVQVSGNSPVLIDRYLRDAIEVDVDAICDGDGRRGVRRAPAYRGSGRAFGRQRLRDPAAQPRPAHRRARSSGRRASSRWRSRSRG